MGLPIYHPEVQQGTPEWHALKAGHWSSSEAAIIMGGPETKGIDGLIKRIAWERVNGPPEEERYKSKAMERGHLVEPAARDWYAFREFVVIEQMGFVQHASLPWVGWSPDGLHLGRRRGIEAKSPLHAAYMDTLRHRKVPACYLWQCRWACWVGQLEAIDFVAYHPTMGGIVVPFEVTPDDCDRMTARVWQLEKKVAEWVDVLREHKRGTKPIEGNA